MPTIIFIHGGPTSQTTVGWNPQAQYFASRGYHHLAVNHRGSTGFGRAYQDMQLGQWGVVDVEDAKSGAEYLVARGLADPTSLVIRGGSAGGYTTLMALTQDPDFWAAGVSLFGVGDLYDLEIDCHRFERNYNYSLMGALPDAGPIWKERSPLNHVKKVKSPVLLFHGKKDKVVPVQQSIDFHQAIQKQGGRSTLILFDEEGHGFRLEANKKILFETMEAFLKKYVQCKQ
jgi:dipeptidyl aminopeptidase/acylaminoacyl peptidase